MGPAGAGEERSSVLCRLAAEGEDTHIHGIGITVHSLLHILIVLRKVAGVAQVALTGLGGLDGNQIHIHGVGVTNGFQIIGNHKLAGVGGLQGGGIPFADGPIAQIKGSIYGVGIHTGGFEGVLVGFVDKVYSLVS